MGSGHFPFLGPCSQGEPGVSCTSMLLARVLPVIQHPGTPMVQCPVLWYLCSPGEAPFQWSHHLRCFSMNRHPLPPLAAVVMRGLQAYALPIGAMLGGRTGPPACGAEGTVPAPPSTMCPPGSPLVLSSLGANHRSLLSPGASREIACGQGGCGGRERQRPQSGSSSGTPFSFWFCKEAWVG